MEEEEQGRIQKGCSVWRMLGPLTHKGRQDRAALPPKKEGEEEGGEGTLVRTTATSTSPGRILLS